MRIDVRDVSVVIETNHIIGGVELTVQPGAVTGLIGPDGSGKSTLLRCVYRALRPVTGTVHIGAGDVWRSGPTATSCTPHCPEWAWTGPRTACSPASPAENGNGCCPHPLTGRPHFVTAPGLERPQLLNADPDVEVRHTEN